MINLLPEELSQKGGILKILDTVKRMSLLLLVIFLLGAAGAGVFLFTQKNKIEKTSDEIANLKQEIASLEESEFKLFLVKQRISQIQGIFSKNTADTSVSKIRQVLNNVPPDTYLYEFKSISNVAEVTFLITNSNQLTTFMSQILASGIYETVSLKDFSLNNIEGGYFVSLELI